MRLGTNTANAFSKVYVLAITSALKGFFDAAVDVTDPGVNVDDDFAVKGDGEVFGLFEGRVLRTKRDG
jgi:hypothetical protein